MDQCDRGRCQGGHVMIMFRLSVYYDFSSEWIRMPGAGGTLRYENVSFECLLRIQE